MNLHLKSSIAVFILLALWLTPVYPIPAGLGQTQPAWEGQIAYVGADGNLWLLRGENPQPFQITSDASEQRRYGSPVFSPKGDMLAYCLDDHAGAGPAQIDIMRSGSWQPIPIAEDVYCSGWPQGSFSWSPDGTRIAYARTFEYAPQPDGSQWSKYHGIWVADVINGSVGELIAPPGKNPLILPLWSPDGKWVRLYESVYLEGLGVLRTWERDSGALYNWLDIGADIFPGFADWSPDSSQLVFDEVSYIGYPGAGLFTATPGAAALKEIYNNSGNGAVQPRWSPDGQKLAFLLRTYGNDQQSIIATSAPDGSNVLWIFGSPAVLGLLDWSPDSQQLLFTSTENTEAGSQTGMYIYDLNSSTSFQVANPMGGAADWAPIPAIEKSATSEGSSQLAGFQAQGSPLAYLAANYQLILFDPASGDQVELSPPLAAVKFWASPSGTRLVYGNQLLNLIFQTDGKLSVQQTQLPGFPSGEQIAWSPDEDRLAYQDSDSRVWMVDASGDFIEIPGASGLPDWSFDQRYLSYCSGGDRLWVVGGGISLREVATPVDCQAQWSSSQPLLAYTVKGSTPKSDQVYVYDAERGISDTLIQGAEIVSWSPDGQLLALRKREAGPGEKYTYTVVDPREGKSMEVGPIDLTEPGMPGWGITEKDYILGPYQFKKNLNQSEKIAETLFDVGQGGKILLLGQGNNGLLDVVCLDASTNESRTLLSANLSGISSGEKPGLWSALSPDSSWTAAYSYDPAGYRYLLTRCDRSRQVSVEASPSIAEDSFSPDSVWYMQLQPEDDSQSQILLYNLANLDRQSLPVMADSPVVWVQTPSISTEETFTVSGMVTDSDGAPVSGATILVDGQPSATSDADGAFTLSGLAAGNYSLSAQKEEWKLEPEQVLLTVPETEGEIAFEARPLQPMSIETEALSTEAATAEAAAVTEPTPSTTPSESPDGSQLLQIGMAEMGFIALISVALVVVLLLVVLVIRFVSSRSRSRTSVQPPANPPVPAEAVSDKVTTGAASKSGPRAEVDALLREGVAEVKAGKSASGLEKLHRVTEMAPDSAVAWLWSGVAAARLKDRKQADQCFQRAKKLGHPKADEALLWLHGQKKK